MIRLTVWVVLNSRLQVTVVGFMGLASYTMYYTTQSNMPKRFMFSLSRVSGKLRPQLDIVSRIESSHDSSCSVPQLWEVSENQVLLRLPYQFSTDPCSSAQGIHCSNVTHLGSVKDAAVDISALHDSFFYVAPRGNAEMAEDGLA